MFHLGFRVDDLDELEIGGVIECGEYGASDVAVLVGKDCRRQMPWGGVDGKAKERELNDRDENHGAECETVAPQLQELLDEHRHRARERARQAPHRNATHWKLSRDRDIRSMNTSSSEGAARAQSSSESERNFSTVASRAAASRPATCKLVPNGATISTPGVPTSFWAS